MQSLTTTPGATKGQSQYDLVLTAIGTGRPEWLRVARALAPATDAGNHYFLLESVSLAIAKNPAGVLAMSGDTFPLDRICTDLRIEPGARQHQMFLADTRAALMTVKAASLLARRETCLKLAT